MQTLFRVILSFLVGTALFGIGVGAGYFLNDSLSPNTQPTANAEQDFALFWEVWNLVEEKFYDQPELNSTVTYGAIRGALNSLEDPYTVFVEPQPRALERARLEGQFGGIGAYVSRDEEGRVLLDPMVNSPSEQAGLQTNDILLKVDDADILTEMTTDEIVLLIRGEVDTQVVLTVEREGEANPIVLTITRAIIETPSVEWRMTEEDDTIGYIRISLFSGRTNTELDRAFEDLREAGAEKYIIDLRGNGGGYLEAAIDVASRFLEGGVVLNEDRRGEDPTSYRVRNGGKVLDAPLVLLVDGGTASASEIVAGALQDYNRATLIGETTFGKGSVQLVYDLSDESSLHVTVAKWFTPENNIIDGVGLSPDIEVLFSEEDHTNGTDPQYQRAVEHLQAS
jgi:carboxyl-terminal processing protease